MPIPGNYIPVAPLPPQPGVPVPEVPQATAPGSPSAGHEALLRLLGGHGRFPFRRYVRAQRRSMYGEIPGWSTDPPASAGGGPAGGNQTPGPVASFGSGSGFGSGMSSPLISFLRSRGSF